MRTTPIENIERHENSDVESIDVGRYDRRTVPRNDLGQLTRLLLNPIAMGAQLFGRDGVLSSQLFAYFV